MGISSARRVILYGPVVVGVALASFAAYLFLGHKRSQPESLAMAPDGMLIVGSANRPYVYKVRPGSSSGEKFIDASTEGAATFFFGVLVDASTNTVWTCQLTPTQNTTPQKLHTSVRGFDISTGSQKLRWSLPGDNSMCNDLVIGPDKALYISDTTNGRIYKLSAGATSAELFLEHAALVGVDGIAFLNGTLYVNNLFSSRLYRIPIDAEGKAGAPIRIATDQPLNGPDGMRAANGRLFLGENGGGRISSITIDGDTAKLIVLKEGLKTPTAVEPAGNTIWIADRGAARILSIPMPR